MRKVRGLVYKLGFRPKRGSIFFSPSLAFHYGLRELTKKKDYRGL